MINTRHYDIILLSKFCITIQRGKIDGYKIRQAQEQGRKNRLKESEWEDLKKCAIHSDLTMADWLRDQVRKYKRLCQKRGDWPEVADRGEDEG